MTTKAYILINCELGKEKDLLENLKTISEISEAHIVMGSFDLICLLEAENENSLRPLVTSKIRSLDGVRQTMTVIIA